MRTLVLSALLTLPTIAFAQNAVEMEARTTVSAGAKPPSITFKGLMPAKLIASVRCGGKPFSFDAPLSPGSSHTWNFTGLGVGRHACSGNVTLKTPDGGTGEMPLNFEVVIADQLKLYWTEADFNLEAEQMTLRASRGMVDIEVDVYGGEAGERIGGGRQPGNEMTEALVGWSAAGEVLKIVITVTDVLGSKSQLTLLPWSYNIPHEDVVFASNEATVQASEVEKLEAAWKDVETVIAKYGDIVEMQLYIAGYTDTVGDAGSNRALSSRRARAIGAWFKKRGFNRPIFVQGFGEEALAVPTPDGTDEVRNRRALYVLAARKPGTSSDLPRANWTRL